MDTVTDMYSQTVRLVGIFQTDLLLGSYEGSGDSGHPYRRVYARQPVFQAGRADSERLRPLLRGPREQADVRPRLSLHPSRFHVVYRSKQNDCADLAIEIFESSSLPLAHTQIEPLDAGLGGVQQPHGEAADLALPLRHRGVHQRRLPGQRDHHAPPHRPLSFSLPRRPRTTSSSAATSSASTPSAATSPPWP